MSESDAAFTIDRALTDERLPGAGLGDVSSWKTWLAILKATFAVPLDNQEREIFASVAGGRAVPGKRVRELWCVAGRRSGKSRISAAIAIYLALFVRHQLARGERGMVLVIAGSLDQARSVFGYVRGFLEASPALANEIAAITRQEIELRNGIVIACHANSYRTVRGRTLVACIMDEVSFWRDETSAAPDIEVYRAIMPSLVRPSGVGLLVGISTPYRKLGLMHSKYRDHYGVDGDDVLIVRGGSRQFNPLLAEETIAAQRAADPTAALSEWDAEFRSDISTFLDDELVDAAVEYGRPLELPPQPAPVFYRAFCDASGGVGADSYTLAVGHKDEEFFVVDLVRGTAGKFDPVEVTRQYAALLREYRITSVTGDNYASEWVAHAWRDTGISYVRSDIPKSRIYLETLPLWTRGLIRLPDHPRLLRELRLLERQTHRGGRESVDHPRNGHDDHANACCGALRALSNHLGYRSDYGWLDRDDDVADPGGASGWQAARLAAYLYSGGRGRL